MQLGSVSVSSKDGLCRTKEKYLKPTDYNIYSCGKCYTYLFHKQQAIAFLDRLLIPHNQKVLVTIPDYKNTSRTHEICSILTEDECQRWLSCCRSADNCCQRQLSSSLPDLNTTCGRTWDGWGCWDDADAGSKNYLACPLFIQHSLPTQAYKTNQSNGLLYNV
ncbi:hypothetical protein KUTeg_008577 [Tegillarca granosa]|uniref:G-protein coupled receptors family 2 profile 1 domain-containing protein n=1 Tax=Tegillarca granosa TaxID=220873 RepID=A0ABQ9F9K0_TEGGR|nr:hypothetical protein KUTeg_008577 [Tegillarca granosa]